MREFFLTAMDPGGDTGLALLHVRPDDFALVAHATVPYAPPEQPPPTVTLRAWRGAHPGPHVLVYEDFHVRNSAAAAGVDTTALKVLGGLDQVLYERPGLYTKVVRRESIQGKHLTSDEVLEGLGLHLGHAHALRHVRDALRHAVAFLAARRYLPVCRVAYPRGGLRSPRPR